MPLGHACCMTIGIVFVIALLIFACYANPKVQTSQPRHGLRGCSGRCVGAAPLSQAESPSKCMRHEGMNPATDWLRADGDVVTFSDVLENANL